MSERDDFFRDLPARKAMVRTGYCEPPEGDLYNSVVVHLDEDCRGCTTLICHMFRSVLDDDGNIIAKVFQPHDPEYG